MMQYHRWENQIHQNLVAIGQNFNPPKFSHAWCKQPPLIYILLKSVTKRWYCLIAFT